MFARLSRSTSRLLDLHWGSVETDGIDYVSPEEGLLSLNISALSELSLPENTLESVAEMCGKVLNPFCQYVESALSADVENLVLALHKADPAFASASGSQGDYDIDDEPIYLVPDVIEEQAVYCSGAMNDTRDKIGCASLSTHEPNTETHQQHPPRIAKEEIFLSSVSPSIPSIVITAAPPQVREMSSCVPIQDTYFGTRLTVPTHTGVNAAHPPMMLPSYAAALSSVRSWTYKHGHWCAVVPGLDEQEKKGIFSRPGAIRRRQSIGSLRKRAGRDSSFGRQNTYTRGVTNARRES